MKLATRLFAHDWSRLSNMQSMHTPATPYSISLCLSFLHTLMFNPLTVVSFFSPFLQLTELEQRVIEAEERAEEAEDKVSH